MAVLKPLGTGYPDAFVATVLHRALALPGPCRVFGITGLQGTGKSTLSAQVAALAEARGLRAVVLSIDDLYLDQPERQRLAREVHPLLATRGAPGSHDLALGRATFDALRAGRARLPAFDKISDRRLPESDWARIDGVPDLVLFEGWFHKVPPQAEDDLAAPINALERDEDADGVWRRWCNAALADYAPLWAELGALLFLQGPGFEQVPEWRWQQEVTLAAANPGRRTMRRDEIERFVMFFERVSRQALVTLPRIADWTVRVDARRHVIERVPGAES
ncbi:kinase [Silanimonas sp.]|uniref:kinase n=1 Tax=Silanimonas sp. TaxID=1929290 RepID=UPI0022BD15A5|nr:kinase [Silanimonas sp.]MCZ8061948.1 kinase [Silanimonas sp.]